MTDSETIAAIDLQTAVREGIRSFAGFDPFTMDPLYKYTYAHAEYITDVSGTIEVEYKPENYLQRELVAFPLNQSMRRRCEEEIRRNTVCRHQVNSHTIVVVDQSGSMRNYVGMCAVSRLQAVYKTIAVELVARELNSEKVSYTDVFSLVTMQDDACCVIDCHPFNWTLYNKILDLSRTRPCKHGNYLPAIQLVHELALKYQDLDKTAVAVMFLSDGAPSDTRPRGRNTMSSERFSRRLLANVATLSYKLGSRLTFNTMLFSSDIQRLDYHGQVLKKMTDRAIDRGAQGRYDRGSTSGDLHLSFSSMMTTMTATKTHLQEWGDAELDSISTSKVRDSQQSGSAHDPEYPYKRYLLKRHKLEKFFFRPHKKGRRRWQVAEPPKGIRIQDAHFGSGAERIVRYMDIIDTGGTVVSTPLVAKESKSERGYQEGQSFHNAFFRTQFLAQEKADEFNQALDGHGVSDNVPRVSFLPCALYGFDDHELNARQWILAEKRLDPSKYVKWNDNNGQVKGTREGRSPVKGEVLPSAVNQETEVTCPSTRTGRTVEFDTWVYIIHESGSEALASKELKHEHDSEGDSSEEDDEENEDLERDSAETEEKLHDLIYGLGENADQKLPVEETHCVSTVETVTPPANLRSQCVIATELTAPPEMNQDRCLSSASSSPTNPPVVADARVVQLEETVLDDDVPQAFTHFTYAHSKRALMVCDLQGVLDRSKTPALFEFTDPCIHHHDKNQHQALDTNKNGKKGKKKGKKKHRKEGVFGRTDRDRGGMHQFFRTHVCNSVCLILGIEKFKEFDKNAGEKHHPQVVE